MNTPGVLRSVPTGKGGGPDHRHPGGMPRRRPRRLAHALRPLLADRSPVPGDVRRAAGGARGRLPGSVRRGLPQPDALPRRGPAVDLDLPDRRPSRVALGPAPPRADDAVEPAAARAAAAARARCVRADRAAAHARRADRQAVAEEEAGAGAVRDRRTADRGGRARSRSAPRTPPGRGCTTRAPS